MRLIALRVARGLRACWEVRGGRFPRGACLAIFLLATFCVGRSILTRGAVNILDLVVALLTGYLAASSFIEGYRGCAKDAGHAQA